MNRKTGWMVVCLFFLAMRPVVSLAQPELSITQPDTYRLGPQDKIQLKVFDLRIGSGEAHQWDAFDGDFSVDASGGVFLPIVGFLHVSNMTVEEVGQSVASMMQKKVGLAEKPSASVQVIKYRPYYISGTVDKPGEYEYRPKLTVLQAVSIAGGFYRSSDSALVGYTRDSMSRSSDINVYTKEITALSIRMARLEAEIAGSSEIKFPPSVKNAVNLDPSVSEAVKSETQVFESRKDSLASQMKTFEEIKLTLNNEIESLNLKASLLDRTVELTQQDLISVRDMMAKGLAVTSRQIGAEQIVASLQSSKLDNQAAKLRAQQELSKLAREAIELRSKLRQQEILDLTSARDKQNEIRERIKAASAMRNYLDGLRETSFQNGPVYSYNLSRNYNGQLKTISVEEGDSLEPGDVLKVVVASGNERKNQLTSDRE